MIQREGCLENAWKDAKHQAGWRIKCETSPTMQLDISMTTSELWGVPDAKTTPVAAAAAARAASSQIALDCPQEEPKTKQHFLGNDGKGGRGAGECKRRQPWQPRLVGTLAAKAPKDPDWQGGRGREA